MKMRPDNSIIISDYRYNDLSQLGDWHHNLESLHNDFIHADPYPSIIIPDFIQPDLYHALLAEFPSIDEPGWFRYNNPIEKKYARDDINRSPAISHLFHILQSPEFIQIIRTLTGINHLENDPHLHGAGLHAHPTHGKLDMHLDYSIHPLSELERRVNLIYFLNETWNSAWGGDLELWNAEFTECRRRIPPTGNTAALFQTSDISWHGLPRPITCPPDRCRQSAAIYYISPPRENATLRLKASFRPLPTQPVTDGLLSLYNIRPSRRITELDIFEHMGADWETNPIGLGHWFI